MTGCFLPDFSRQTMIKEKKNNSAGKRSSVRQYVARSRTNQRENNEDSFLACEIRLARELPPVTLLAVSDGMGGLAHGEDVSREALRKLSLALFESLIAECSLNRAPNEAAIDERLVGEHLLDAVEQTNAHITRLIERNRWGSAGATLVTAAIFGRTALALHLGDSALFHFQPKPGRLRKLTEDHTIAAKLVRAGMLTEDEARRHPTRSHLEFYVGTNPLPPDFGIFTVKLKSGDLLLLCSDGVSGKLSDESIAEVLKQYGGDLNNAANELLQAALVEGETDNQTLILCQL